ncbi:MAG: hypothetical protein Q4A04_09960, partial [Eubacteriales bacterium]|nr:hypothetical protein [Eubacteriales bacterium]
QHQKEQSMKAIKAMAAVLILAGMIFFVLSVVSWWQNGIPEAGVTVWSFVFFMFGAVFSGMCEE